ncbi:hypothetical protein [Sphingobacterium sp. MYb382]
MLPDLSMIGYAARPKGDAFSYNLWIWTQV